MMINVNMLTLTYDTPIIVYTCNVYLTAPFWIEHRRLSVLSSLAYRLVDRTLTYLL